MVIDSYHKEIGRKVIHIFALGYLAVYFVFSMSFGHRAGLLALTGMLVVLIVLEYCRLQLKINIPLLSFFYNFRRQNEENTPGAELYFLLGVLVSLSVFDTGIAVSAVLMAVFGDMAAALVGGKFGRVRPSVFGGRKSLEGSAAGLLANFAIGFLCLRTAGTGCLWWHTVVGPENLLGHALWPVVAAMALTATVVELAVSKIDDNLTVPVISGFVGQMALLLLA